MIGAVDYPRLEREFYLKPTLVIARELLGQVLASRCDDGITTGRIVEVEAYVGPDDPASHAFSGRTRRNDQMWGRPGTAYVYASHGIHRCLNVVTEDEGYPAAVLIRALEPLEGIALMQRRRGRTELVNLASGPGKLCKALGIDLPDNGTDLVTGRIFLMQGDPGRSAVAATPRIGVSRGQDQLWRFAIVGNRFVSARKPGPADIVKVD